jgi:amino acid transporter
LGIEAQVEERGAALPRERGLTDLALTQVLFVVGLPWVGVAAKQGPSHVIYWLIAMALFYVPSAIVVIHLNRIMPLEGGLYQWARLGFNDLTGFLVAWNLWLFAILNTSETGLQITQYFTYVVGPDLEWLAGNTWVIMFVSALTFSALVLLAIRGLSVGKWLHKACSRSASRRRA